ncbi:variable surface protein [Plasmodium gonderi]|uniref:Variable surface protein n=1 Tax=Plasmodium gonderi TaxID=77519 RepID=A0A1Y1JJ03_PLAGO|nr:variable surface protein [Plasmodium gonderi]GAW80433.1 variable surface protein [Plasmodium gonderi]
MDDDIENETLEHLENKVASSVLSGLYSHYKLFDAFKSTSSAHKICDEENYPHKLSKLDENVVSICHNLEEILENFDNYCTLIDKTNHINCCEHLLYWMYGKINKEQWDVFNIQWIYFKFHKLLNKNISFNTQYKCNPEFLRVLDKGLLKNKKSLYDFLENYDAIKKALDNELGNNNYYCKYIKKIFLLYQKLVKEPGSQSIHAYKHEMKRFKEKIIDDELGFITEKCNKDSQIPLFDNETKVLNALINGQEQDIKIIEERTKNKYIYDIFRDFDKYMEYINLVKSEKNSYSSHADHYCENNMKTDILQSKEIKNVCKHFISYISYLSLNINEYNPRYKKYFGFLNYWLNNELKNTDKCATDFLKILENSVDRSFVAFKDYSMFKNYVYNIDGELREEMDILYKLYNNLNVIISSKEEKKCQENGKTFIHKFEEGIKKYNLTRNNDFYVELMKVWSRYINAKVKHQFCKNNSFPESPKMSKLNHEVILSYLSKTSELCETYTNQRLPILSHTNEKYEGILKSLSTSEIYKKLNSVTADVDTCVQFCTDVININNSDEKTNEIKKFCPQIAANIRKLSETLKETKSPYDRCTYLTYWAYENIMNVYSNNLDNINNKTLINELSKVVFMANSELSKENQCLFYFYGDISELKNEKHLHDYFKNYSEIKDYITSIEDNNRHAYCEYLKHINELYKSYIGKCCICFSYPEQACSEKCPKYFRCDKQYFPSDLMSTIGCQSEQIQETIEDVFKSVTLDHGIQKYTLLKSLNSNTDLHQISNEISQQNLYENQYKISEQISIYDPFNDIVLSSFGILGIFLTFFVFYKFTPLGSWFYRRKYKNKNISKNIQKINPKIVKGNKSQGSLVNSQKKRIRLAYQSS